MRIAMIGHKRYGSREGGVEVVVTELARRMAALGHEVTCYDRRGEDSAMGELAGERFVDGVRVVPVRTFNFKGAAALSSSFFATRTAIKDRPDVIHYHAEGPCVFLPMARRAGIRTVATVHGLDWQRAKWGRFASRVIRMGERAAAKYTDGLIVLSRSARDYFDEEYGCDAQIIPNGVSPVEPVRADEISSRWGLTKGSYVLYLGRIVPEKRLELLLEAFCDANTDKRLVIAGGASDTSGYLLRIKALASRDSRVLMTGFVKGGALAELCSNAYCCVLPSDVEGMPMSLLEAMAYGRCCITSDIPECADVLAGTGMTFPAGDAEALRSTLAALLEDPARAKALGTAARKRTCAEYDWDRVVRQTLAVYAGEATA